MLHKRNFLIVIFIGLLLTVCSFWLLLYLTIKSYDWPMWRYDANRSAASPQRLPKQLYLQWVREYPKLTQAWENPLNKDLMQFDKVYEPVVQGKTLFIGSNASDRMVALDTETGEEKWKFYVDGPVRFPPVVYKKKVYFVSDDGYLYCVDAKQGKSIWKFRGGPSDRKILGNGRLISTWPARGGPVLKDGIIYFAAGIWPFMGVFIYALDADTGKVIWANDGTGSIYMKQPHNSPSYAGLAPQGSFVVAGDKLLIPCGRSVPACLDRQTGKLLYYHLSQYNKTGGAFVCALGDFFINYHRNFVTSIYDLSKGHSVISRFGNIPVMTKKALFSMGGSVIASKLEMGIKYEKVKDSVTQKVEITESKKWLINQLWKCNVDASGDLIKAGKRLYAGGKNVVSAIEIPSDNEEPKVPWRAYIDGTAARLIAADKKLFVVTLEGSIYAFGSKDVRPKIYPNTIKKTTLPKNILAKAESILKAAAVVERAGRSAERAGSTFYFTEHAAGYCLAYGLETGDLVEALAQKSDLHIIAVDPDPLKVDRLRRRFDAAGLYGKRISVHVGDPFSFEAPPYLASLTVFESKVGHAASLSVKRAGSTQQVGHAASLSVKRAGSTLYFQKIYRSIRPYGGIACLPVSKDQIPAIIQQIEKSNLPKAKVREVEQAVSLYDNMLLLIREGALPGSADWTHQYGDIANTVKSNDQLVKLPLGLLWFGGSSNMDVLPRHGHGPPEQIIGGRLFIEGIKSFSARDVYTGRVLWKRDLPNLDTYGVYYDETYKNTPLDPAYNQVHIPGANARNTNFVATMDKIYVAQKNSCLVLHPATGKTLKEIKLPLDRKTGKQPEWGYIGVYKNYLIAGAGFAHYTDFLDASVKKKRFYNFDISSSKKLIVMNRHTGKVIWVRNSKLGFRHSAIAVGDDKIFCIDMLPPTVSDALKRRGKKLPGTPKLIARDLRTGKIIWSTTKNVFGTWLSYSKKYDILLQAGRSSRDMLKGEPKGMTTYRGKDGTVLWSNNVSYGGPCILHGDTIITDRYAYSLLTGKQKMRIDPLTGEEKKWQFKRNYGCNYAIASEHLLTFRSAAGGFCDLTRDGGTGNFGGFRSGCTSNLIAANGVLNAPDYTRTCSCSYQNQASLALVHMPELEMWTTYFSQREDGVIASSSTAIAFADLTGYLTYVNNSFLKLWGYDDESEVLGRSALELWLTEEKALEVADILRDKGKWVGELVGVKKDGSALKIHLSAKIVTDENNDPVYMMASFVDITNRKSTEVGRAVSSPKVKHPDFKLRSSQDLDKLIIGDRPIRSVGLNLGAPGDCMADNGTLWLEYPRVGGPSPEISVSIDPDDYERFVHHSSRIQGDGLKWVVASGLKGVSSVKIRLAGKPDKTTTQATNKVEQIEEPMMNELRIQERPYTVRLYFAEPDDKKPGQRVFDIAIQGQKVLEYFDIVKEAGGPNRAVVKEFKSILVKKDLTLAFTPSNNAMDVPLVCGIEILAEGW